MMTKTPSAASDDNAPRDYVSRHDGWVAGRRVSAGDIVSLTPSAARYENVDPAPAAKAAGRNAAEAGGK